MISILGCEIGRGHPFYLDGLLAALEQQSQGALVARRSDVFGVSRGAARLAWQSVRASYRIAGRGAALEALYRRVRGQVDYDGDAPLLRLLGRDLRRWAGGEGLLVVDHPAVVGALGGRPDVWYLHGEHAAPPESIVRRAARVLVPTEETAEAFAAGGVEREHITVTGLCVEAALLPDAEPRARARRGRIAGPGPLTLAFFSSGAEPVRHVAALAAGAAAVAGSHRTLVFAERGGRLERAARRIAARAGAPLVGFRGRAELDRVTAAHFDAFDVVVSPPHERVNWALALGVPFLLVGPDVGAFAPRNRALVLRAGVAAAIGSQAEAERLADTLARLRADGSLLAMSRRGEGRPRDGFAVAARALAAAAD